MNYDQYRDELQPAGTYPAIGGRRSFVQQRRNTVLSEAENMRRTVERNHPLFQMTSRDYLMISPRIFADNVARGFVIDANPVPREEFGGKDVFGVEWVYVDSVGGSMVVPGEPLMEDANEWEDKVIFPDLDALDWEAQGKANESLLDPHRLTSVWVMNGLFERLISFMDYGNAAMALIDEDQMDAVLALFDRLADFYIDLIGRYRKYFHVDAVYFHDDWGSQNGPIFSLDTAMEMLVPALRKISDAVHAMGMIFEMHSCGKNEMLLPAYIAGGADIWAGQPMNDFDAMYEAHGAEILLGIPVSAPEQATLEECLPIAEAFLDTYSKYPFVACPTFGSSPNLRDAIYLVSRARLQG